MTTTTSPHDTGEIPAGEATRNLAPFIEGLPPTLRRPDATGEHPILAPVGVAELARLSAGETLVLPADAIPSVPREPVPTVYPPAPDVQPRRYQGEHRKPDPTWAIASISVGAVLVVEAVVALVIRVVTW